MKTFRQLQNKPFYKGVEKLWRAVLPKYTDIFKDFFFVTKLMKKAESYIDS